MANLFLIFILCCEAFAAVGCSAADIYGAESESGLYLSTDSWGGGLPLLMRENSDAGKQKPSLDELIRGAAGRYRIDEALLRAVVRVESNYDPLAVSPKGAVGLMQLLPGTAKRYGISNLKDAGENIDAGARYLRHLLAMFGGDRVLALAAYNAGENSVLRHGNRVPPFRETREYVPRVLRFYRDYRRSAP